MVYIEVFDDIKGMVRASSKNNIDLHMILELSQSKSNLKAINIANTLNTKRNMFSAYVFDQTEGSCGQRGSIRLEQNHSYLISFIGEEYTGELEDILTKLLLWQKKNHLRLTNF